jgi:tetratricopeptide (TPR) repeat protein
LTSNSLYTLLNRPSLFNAYISASPVLTNNHEQLNVLAEKKLKLLTDKPRYLFLSMGNSDYEQEQAFETLSKHINAFAPKQLQWNVKKFDNHNYMSQPILATINAIEDIFKDVHNVLEPDSDISRQGQKAIIEHYQYLSNEKYGFHVSAEESLKALGSSLLEKSPEKAFSILETVIKTYPESAYAFHEIAKAYAKVGNYEKAVHYQEIATLKAKDMFRWHKNNLNNYLKEYKLKLTKKD